VLGGTQSLHTNSMDEALGLPTESAARIALRTQQVIAFESGAADIVDPFAGSYAIEELTTRLETQANEYIGKIDAMGGMLRAIETGYVQREIQDAAYDFQREVETNDAVVVGVNKFRLDEGSSIPVLSIDLKIERDQVARLRALRDRRDQSTVTRSLARLQEAANGTENLMPLILEAVENYATVGEISHCLRGVWGEFREAVTF